MDLSKFNSYSDVLALSEEKLRTLLSTDDQTVLVWAAWALGIRMNGASCPPEVKILLDTEPTPGVRQNLLVFFAGSGDHDLLEAYARTDPNADVRAAACNLIARVATDIQKRNYLLEELLTNDKSVVVRSTILDTALRDKRQISLHVLRNIIVNEDSSLQAKALHVVSVQRSSSDSNKAVHKEMYEWANHIHPDIYETYCSLSYDMAGGEHVLRLSHRRLEFWSMPINVLIKNGYKTTWFDLNQLANKIDITGIPLLLGLLNDDSNQETAVWLLRIMALSLSVHFKEYDYGIPQVCDIALPILNAILHKSVTPCKTEYAAPVLKLIHSELSYAQSPDPDDTWNNGDNSTLIDYYEDFSNRLREWV